MPRRKNEGRGSSPVKRGRGTAEGGGGGNPKHRSAVAAPSTMLRMVLLPRFAGEEPERLCLDMHDAYRVAPTTSTVPVSVRALRSGRYMSYTVAAGWAKVPGDTARMV